ncbi:MAG: nucleoside-triphosphatase [Thermoanaerobaculaceae bacterium]|jgi:nucleoside-triphosphatase THEP1
MSGRPGARQWRSDPRWLRAAALGSVWAASEIILGSFLHNLKVPFRGHALTAIAVLLVSGAQRRWGQRGVVARAGLVAAIMKSASPSAVLLGPMLAISMEGFAFELGLGLGRGGLLGCLIGGVLAMSWTLLHMLLSLLLSYGANLIEVYRQLVALAAQQLGPLPFGAVGPLAALAMLNMTVGAAAALTGWRVGGRASTQDLDGGAAALAPVPVRLSRPAVRVTPRLFFLVLTLAALPIGLVALSRASLATACIGMAVVLAGAGLRYRAALRRLARPGFWVGVIMIAATAALVGRLGSGAPLPAALTVAAMMTLRAVFVAACFAAIDVELAHPGLRASLERHGAGALLGAAEAAFATLPEIIASVPSGRDLVRRPAAALASILPRLDALVDGFTRDAAQSRVVILTGERGSGKTTLAAEAVERLRSAGLKVGGILAPGTLRDGTRFSFDILDLSTGESLPFGCREPRPGWLEEKCFWVSQDGLALGRVALARSEVDVLVVDEVGPWELAGSGWSRDLETLVGRDVPLLLVVRHACLAAVVSRWCLSAAEVFEVSEAGPDRIAEPLLAAATRRPLP